MKPAGEAKTFLFAQADASDKLDEETISALKGFFEKFKVLCSLLCQSFERFFFLVLA
jgi:hypothetical protein